LLQQGNILIDDPFGSVYAIEFVDFQDLFGNSDQAIGNGALYGKDFELDSVGHSLGGHLANAFTRFSPEIGAEAITFSWKTTWRRAGVIPDS
jgi:hypothetical protein